ncbi:SGNH/GDSL hydrolase family protein [Leptospira ognonensis]|nr:SGNH/GDSL hydrolase family protein [Leptospira ognonensis]
MKEIINVYLRFFLVIPFAISNCYHSKKDDLSILTLLSQNAPPVRVTIVGDSLSQWSDSFNLRQKLPSSYTITDVSRAGYDTIMWLEDLALAEAIATDIYIVEIGTNDASYNGSRDFLNRYSQIIRRLEQRSNSFLILTAVPKTNQTGLHEAIQTNNTSIREFVKTNGRYRLADLELVFTSASENLTLYPITDPIHPNLIGYNLIGEEYRKILLGL